MKRREFLQKIGLTAVATTAAGGVLAAPPTLPPRSTIVRRPVPLGFDTTSVCEGVTPTPAALRHEEVVL